MSHRLSPSRSSRLFAWSILLSLLFLLSTPALLSHSSHAVARAEPSDAATAHHGIDYDKEHSNYGTDKKEVKEKLKEQVKEATGSSSISADDELFYFFSLHDYNTDSYLDGHELMQAIVDYAKEETEPALKLDEIIEMIDHIMLEDDVDGDGKISWSEYLASQSYHEG